MEHQRTGEREQPARDERGTLAEPRPCRLREQHDCGSSEQRLQKLHRERRRPEREREREEVDVERGEEEGLGARACAQQELTARDLAGEVDRHAAVELADGLEQRVVVELPPDDRPRGESGDEEGE